MRGRGHVVTSALLATIIVACSAAPSSDPRGALPAAARATPAPAPHVLAAFEGSFDSATRTLTFASRDSVTGALHPETTLPEGEDPGDVYLHTEGNGDGLPGPTWDSSTDVLRALVDLENGTGSALYAASVTLDLTPATVGMLAVEPAAGCLGPILGASSRAGPCHVAYGGVGVDSIFPAPCPHLVAHPGIWIFDDSLNDGADFHFTGTISAEFASATALVSSGSPTAPGAPITFTATPTAVPPATGTPAGWVNFSFIDEAAGSSGNLDCNGSGSQQVTLSGGSATCVAPLAAAGTYLIDAQYAGDPNGNFVGSLAEITQTVE